MGYKDDNKKSYVHFVTPARLNKKWPSEYKFVLVENMDHLREVFNEFKEGETLFSMDLETSSLDPEVGIVVSVGISFDGVTGYHIPINHYDDDYNLYDEGMEYIYDKMVKAKRVMVFGGKFDVRFWEYHGCELGSRKDLRMSYVKFDMSKVKIYDVMVPVWLSDTNFKMPSLEWASLHFLGIKQPSFKETTAGVENFHYIHPEKAAYYGASDAICTFQLAVVTKKYFQEGGYAAKLDNWMVYPLNHLERERISLDRKALMHQEERMTERVAELEEEIFKEIGKPINLNSPQQVSEAFQSIGVDTGQYTKSGYMSTSIVLFERMTNEKLDKWPVLRKFVEYKQSYKILSSYIQVLAKEAKEVGYLRCNYKTCQVPTGRLASGKDEKNSYFSKINIQSIPKPDERLYYVLDLGDRGLFNKKENIIMGYQFILAEYDDGELVSGKDKFGDKYIGLAEGLDQDLNVRKAFLAGDSESEDKENDTEWIFCSIDYAAQELRIPTNFCREPIWLDAFVNNKDVHRETAINLMGKENYSKEARGKAKGANFGILYGMTAESLADRFRMSKAEGQEFYDNYKATLSTLFGWVDRICRRARRDGTAYTYFSRPRRIRYYFENNQAGFGYRTIVNTTVQGTGADVLKIAILKLWRNLYNHPENKNDARFLTTVHDEIDMALRRDRLEELLNIAVDSMRIELPEWPVPLEVEASLGYSWGNVFPFEKVGGEFRPLMKG